MSRPHVLAFAFLALVIGTASIASAGAISNPEAYWPTLTAAITTDGQVDEVNIPVSWVEDATSRSGGFFLIGGSDEGFYYSNGGDWITLSGGLDPDPVMGFGGAVFDFGAPSSFSFTFIMPLAPAVSNPSYVFDSFAGSVVNGAAAGSVTVTALAPPPGIPTDGDGDTEIQVYTLWDSVAGAWKNVGLDAGPTTVFSPLGPGQSATYTEINQGFIPTVAGGPWTIMRADINFGLSGGGDIFTFAGRKILVPEPGTIGMGALAFLAGALVRRSGR